MKSNEVYRALRQEIGPWAKAQGFKRAAAMLSWYRQHHNLHIVFWFQVSQDGWDQYAGSKFTVEFQLSQQPVVGDVSLFRERLGCFLDDSTREEARRIQNEIISPLPQPPKDHPFLLDKGLCNYYLAKFQTHQQRYPKRDDIWFRYYTQEHLHLWSRFVLEHLPHCIHRVEGLDSQVNLR